MSDGSASPTFDDLARLAAAARRLEAEGQYNAAKLFRAALDAALFRAGRDYPTAETVDELMGQAIAALPAGMGELAAAMRRARGLAALGETILSADIPQVWVCRACGEPLLGDARPRCPSCGADAATYKEILPVFYLELRPPDEVMALLAGFPAMLDDTLLGLTDEQMAARRDSPSGAGEWSLREALWHLLVSQRLLAGRVEAMLREDNPPMPGLAAWNLDPASIRPATETLAAFRVERAQTLDLLRQMPPSGWWRTGVHAEFGRVSVLVQAAYFARHERSHLPQILELVSQVDGIKRDATSAG